VRVGPATGGERDVRLRGLMGDDCEIHDSDRD
jgi:hypothetical protein